VEPAAPAIIAAPVLSVTVASAEYPPTLPKKVDHTSEPLVGLAKLNRVTKATDPSTGAGCVRSHAPAVMGKSPERVKPDTVTSCSFAGFNARPAPASTYCLPPRKLAYFKSAVPPPSSLKRAM
jgi:hypothetical protein